MDYLFPLKQPTINIELEIFRIDIPVGNACSLVRNISIGLMIDALNVRASDPAMSGANVRGVETVGVDRR